MRKPLRTQVVCVATCVSVALFIVAHAPLLAQSPFGARAPIDVAPVERGEVFDEVRLSGSVQPRRVAHLAAEVSARIEEMLVDEGDVVAAGQALVRLRGRPTELMLEQARAQARDKRAALDELVNGTRPEDIAQAQADVVEAEALLALAEAEEARVRSLFESRTVSQAEFDRASAEKKRAGAVLMRRRAVLERAVAGPRVEAIAAARSEWEANEARVAQLEEELERHVVRAPFDSVIGVKHAEQGQWIRPGEPLFSLAELGVLRVEVALPETYWRFVAPGTPAHLTFDALPGVARTIAVSQRIPLASQAARTFPVRFEFENEGYRFAPGMMARATFELHEPGAPTSLLLPKDAVVLAPDRSEAVWVVRETAEGTQAFSERVRTGRSFRDKVELVDGNLAEGDLVVVRGNETLFPGQKIEVRRAGGEPVAQAGGPGT
jgi:RND family efflux transporter MFP subunit